VGPLAPSQENAAYREIGIPRAAFGAAQAASIPLIANQQRRVANAENQMDTRAAS